MVGFVDETVIDVSSGNGGAGCVSFRREKYVPKGGPDGGDGGKGGSVVFVVRENVRTLSHLKMRRTFKAENGRPGRGRRMHGSDGEDVVIPLPPGCIIREFESGRLIKDMERVDCWVFLTGGKGGLGNPHFATSTRQTPRYAQPGLPGTARRLKVEMNIIADIGFVGLPNAGKSSLLAALTNATPKIGSYPFTTTIPNLGVMNAGFADIMLADIPGIIEGASHGAGLGIMFLKHISRTRGLAILIDLTDPDYASTFSVLIGELRSFSEELARKPRIVIGTKTDLFAPGAELEERRGALVQSLPDEKVLTVSVFARTGIDEVKRGLVDLALNEGGEREE